jgi:hypothetical protein
MAPSVSVQHCMGALSPQADTFHEYMHFKSRDTHVGKRPRFVGLEYISSGHTLTSLLMERMRRLETSDMGIMPSMLSYSKRCT